MNPRRFLGQHRCSLTSFLKMTYGEMTFRAAAFRMAAVRVALVLAIFGSSVVADQNELSVERVSAAFAIAEETAAAGLGELSTNAVARALQFGPPVRSERDGQNPLIFRSVVVDINQPIPESHVRTFQRSLPARLMQLSQIWAAASVSPEFGYRALRVCVNPPGRPDQLFLYSVSNFTNSAFPASINARCVASELVNWAKRAGRLNELKSSFEEQQLDAVAEGCFVFLLIAIEQDDPQQIQTRCRQLSRYVQRAASTELLRLLAATLLQAPNSVQRLAEVQDLLSAVSATLLSVDPQTEGESAFAVTAANKTWQLKLQAARLRPDSNGLQEVLESADQLIARRSGLSKTLAARLSESLADSVLIFDLAERVPNGALKQAVRLRQVRFPADRWIADSDVDSDVDSEAVIAAEPSFELPEGIEVHWNATSGEHQDALWCQILNRDAAAESSEPTLLFAVSGLQSMGHPTTNFDGSIVAFHGHQLGHALGSGSHIYILDRTRQTVTDLGPGVRPSLSPTGTRLTCSRYTPNKGIWLVRSDGTNWTLIDQQGWGSKFSPDGSAIAYSLPQQPGASRGPHSRKAERQPSESGLRVRSRHGSGSLLRLFPVTLPGPGLAVFCFSGAGHGWVGSQNSTHLESVAFGGRTAKPGSETYRTLPSVLIDDLDAAGPSEFVWLGAGSPTSPAKHVYWSGQQQQPVSLNGRLALGVHLMGQRQVLILSKKGTP